MIFYMKEVRMQAGIVRNFYILDPIAADSKKYNYSTGREELIESKTSQRYFVDNLAGLGSGDAVNLYINCTGGSVKEALGIHSTLQRCPATVTAYIDGFACSAASVIAMAAQKVIMPRNTAMMIHNAATLAYGNAQELRKAADDLDVINNAAIQSYIMHAGDKLSADKLQEMLDAETWLTAEDCIKWGLADDLAGEVSPDTALAQYTAAAARASANGFDARLFENPPAFLADRYRAPAKMADEKLDNSSYISRLLKNMKI